MSFHYGFQWIHDTNNYRSGSSPKKGRITTLLRRYGLCGSVLSTVASLRLEMSLVKDTEHMIRLDDCFDSLLHPANYEKVKKYIRTYPAFLRGVAGSIPYGWF